jgi:hypothetical protein
MWRTNLTLVIVAAVGLLALCVSAQASDPNLIAHWMLDEGTGSIAYDSAAGNDGIIYGASWTTGQVEGALEFDGLDDYVDLGNDVSLKPSLPVTVCAWVNLSGSGKHQRIISIDEQSLATYYGFWLHILSTDRVRVGFGDGRGGGSQTYRRSKIGTTILGTDTWYHVVAVIRGATDMDVYVNGVDDGGSYEGSGGSLAYSSGFSYIGRNARGTNYFDGAIDDVRIYDGDLSDEEVEELYWTGIGGSGLAIFEIEQALAEKEAVLGGVDVALEKELVAYGALEELLAGGDYEGLSKRDIDAAQRKIESAIRRQERSKRVVAGSIKELEDALLSLGWEPEPEPNEPIPEPNAPEPNMPVPAKLLRGLRGRR